REALEIKTGPGLLSNLAQCEERQGRNVKAWRYLKQAAELLADDEARRTAAEQMLASAAAKIAFVRIERAPGTLPEAKLRSAAEALAGAEFDVEHPVEPGSHTVIVIAPGASERTYTFAVVAGEKKVFIAASGMRLPTPPQGAKGLDGEVGPKPK